MKKIIFITITIILILNFNACIGGDCGTGAYGTIVDINNIPIEGAKVLLQYDSSEITRYSDINGEYNVGFMHGCPADGKGDLHISKEGYITQVIKVNGGDDSKIDITLEVDPQAGTE